MHTSPHSTQHTAHSTQHTAHAHQHAQTHLCARTRPRAHTSQEDPKLLLKAALPLPAGQMFERLAWGPDGTIAAALGGSIHFLDSSSGKVRARCLPACSRVRVWRAAGCRPWLQPHSRHTRCCRQCIMPPAAAPRCRRAHTHTRKQVLEVLHAHEGPITALVWCPRRLALPPSSERVAVLASASADRRVRIWRSPAAAAS
jgi:WD40 repeat protein